MRHGGVEASATAAQAIEWFQTITTAYHVLSNKNAVKAYWDMFRLRCYLYQSPHEPNMQLLPFYLLVVKKRDERGMWQAT